VSRLVFGNGTIVSALADRRRLRAVAVEGSRIVAVDDEALAGGGLRVDLRGRTLVPGFHDGHIHPVFGGPSLVGAPVRDAESLDELLVNLRSYAANRPEPTWIRGFGYNPALLPNGYGDATVLDSAVSDRPVALTASDGHTMWVNSKALAAAGITAATQDPERGKIVRREDGSPLGALLESAQRMIEAAAPPHSIDERRSGILAALSEMARHGITWGQDAWAGPDDVGLLLTMAGEAALPCRVNLAMVAAPEEWPRHVEAMVDAKRRAEEANSEWVTARTVKFFADGIIETGTAALLEPYCDAPHRGIPNFTDEELVEAVTTFHSHGFQIHIHAIGDGAIRSALDAIGAAGQRNGPLQRPVIAHTQLVDPADLPRFATLGVIANFEPLWARLDPIMVDLTIPRLGSERAVHQYPIGSLLRSQARVSFGSDWPISSMDPLQGMAVAVTRCTETGEPSNGWLPDERIDLDTALRTYTAGSAYQAGLEAESGSIEVGRRADLAIINADLDKVDPMDLWQLEVEQTYLNGVPVR